MPAHSSQPEDSENLNTLSDMTDQNRQAQEARNEETSSASPTAETPSSSSSETENATPEDPSPESQLPPEAQGEMNGGPLGCCLGVLVGLLISVSVPLISRAFGDPLIHTLGGGWLSLLVRILMAVVAFIAVIICGRWGWRIGLRIYREYPAPVIRARRRTR
jgi:hypothetical protein